MTAKEQKKDLAASVRQRLLNAAQETSTPFDEVLLRYAMERFLYRLSRSAYASRFVLKGALLLDTWGAALYRPTRDIDLLGRLHNDPEEIASAVKAICIQPVEPDGLVFDADSVRAVRITEEAVYEGVRVSFKGELARARITMQIDIGFGDAVVPAPAKIMLPARFDLPPVRMQGYTRDSVIAEKFETMMKLGIINSRLKDYYDIWLLSQRFEFDGERVATAIKTTFARRGTEFRLRPTALSEKFVTDPTKVAQWTALRRKARLDDAPASLDAIITRLRRFLGPIIKALVEGKTYSGTWPPGGPWK
ncbi:MAG: nucleotidyl transferase AbiEii/AbiGii toxin family protein [Myxococcales bacterium]|nr:nucleotidyl transferase AbiEii/AbiGii toxin family protein [Myxococcales bacterium]